MFKQQAPERPPDRTRELVELTTSLISLRDNVREFADRFKGQIEQLAPEQQASARNLLHYVALRQSDLRALQERLAQLGLSSLGRAEQHVLANVEALLRVLHVLTSAEYESPPVDVDFPCGRLLLEQHTDELLGRPPTNRAVRIMVTMPSEAARDYNLVRTLLVGGMDVMRINCAHDDRYAWQAMIDHLRRAEAETGRQAKILLDLPGPKLRTGPLRGTARVRRWKPQRNVYGRVIQPARIWLYPEEGPQSPDGPADAELPIRGDWVAHLEVGDRVRFRDARKRQRMLKVVARSGNACWVECKRTAYVQTGTRLHLVGNSTRRCVYGKGVIGNLPPISPPLLVRQGDTLVLTDPKLPSQLARYDQAGNLLRPASIGCTLPEVFANLREGERILLDDGKIAGVLRTVSHEQAVIEITRARAKGEKLGEGKGINLPDSDLNLPALTDEDLGNLPFVVEHADLVGYSFVRQAADLDTLQQELQRLGGEHLGVVLKVETKKAFENLPSLLLAALRSRAAGVMIARGDLAVECGWERLAEIQEEMLWMCEAAHLPVIWATQVLESLAKGGFPSRAEITDAAMSERAECVMLNKGPYIAETMQTLVDILCRMSGHQCKKRPMLRKLAIAEHLSAGEIS